MLLRVRCSKLGIRQSLSLFVVSRTPFSPIDAASSPYVPVTVVWTQFPSAGGIFYTNSAGGWSPVGVIVHLCSFASSIIFLRPTSQARTCREFGLWSSPTGRAEDDSRSSLGSPGFCAKSLHTCSGSLTSRVRCATRVSATYRIAFPTKSQGRQPEKGDFGVQ